MSFNHKKLLSIVLSLILVFTACFKVYATSNNNDSSSIQEIYYDGNKFTVETKEYDTVQPRMGGINIKSKTVVTSEGNDLMFELDHDDSTATLKGKSVQGLEDGGQYDIIVHELTQERIIADVYQEGQLIEKIDEDPQKFEGQTITINLLLVVGIILAVVVTAASVIILGGLTYTAVKSLVDALRRNAPNEYFPALMYDNKVFMLKDAITFQQASSRLKSGLNIYSFSESRARAAAYDVNRSIEGPQIDTNRKLGGHYYYHFHPLGIAYRPHALFGICYIN